MVANAVFPPDDGYSQPDAPTRAPRNKPDRSLSTLGLLPPVSVSEEPSMERKRNRGSTERPSTAKARLLFVHSAAVGAVERGIVYAHQAVAVLTL